MSTYTHHGAMRIGAHGKAGRRPWGRCDELFAPDGVELLIYRGENYGCWSCGIRLLDLGLVDPPTVFWNTCGDDECQTTGVVWLDSFSTACVEMVLTESMLPSDQTLCRTGELCAEEIPVLERTFPKLGLPTYPVTRPPCEPGITWFGGDDVLLRLHRYIGTRGDAGSGSSLSSWDRPLACAAGCPQR
jgi:hypothetical protein